MTTEEMPELLTVREAAEFLGVRPSTIHLYRRNGWLNTYRAGGKGNVRIPKRELLDMLKPSKYNRYDER